MCGILGLIGRPGKLSDSAFTEALNTIFHRGPDDFAFTKTEISPDWEMWLGHRRLSILDLSPNGRQPMHYLSGGSYYDLTYNGEIYNYQQLRKELNFQARSDTDSEVLLNGLIKEGSSFLKKMNGMWAFSFFDRAKKTLLLSRDRLGKKPLYIYKHENLIAFASEIKPLKKLGLNLTLNSEALAYYRWLGYIPGTMTVYKELSKFPASSFCEFDFSSTHYKEAKTELFWDPLASYGTRFAGTYNEAIDHFLEVLDDATLIRSMADVPVGVFLSGGIDSSLVISSLAAQNKRDVKAYTVSFDKQEFDESKVAVETCRQLNFDLEVLSLKEEDFKRQVGILSHHYDEPFSDSSQIPTLAISQLAKSKVTVILTGDGGDEVFLGYPRFSFPSDFWKYNRSCAYVPGLRTLLAKTLNSTFVKPVLGALVRSKGMASTYLDAKILRFSEILRDSSKDAIYDSILAITPKRYLSAEDQAFLKEASFMQKVQTWYPEYSWDTLKERSEFERYAALDLVSYMRDDVLVKVDRGTMAYGLEARSPLLDYRIVSLGLSLPLEFKIREGQYKALLRSALKRRLPGDISKLAKRGFGVPLPENLEPGLSLASRWNSFVEKEWRSHYRQ